MSAEAYDALMHENMHGMTRLTLADAERILAQSPIPPPTGTIEGMVLVQPGNACRKAAITRSEFLMQSANEALMRYGMQLQTQIYPASQLAEDFQIIANAAHTLERAMSLKPNINWDAANQWELMPSLIWQGLNVASVQIHGPEQEKPVLQAARAVSNLKAWATRAAADAKLSVQESPARHLGNYKLRNLIRNLADIWFEIFQQFPSEKLRDPFYPFVRCILKHSKVELTKVQFRSFTGAVPVNIFLRKKARKSGQPSKVKNQRRTKI